MFKTIRSWIFWWNRCRTAKKAIKKQIALCKQMGKAKPPTPEEVEKFKKEFDMGILLITHDLGVVAQVSDRVSVMYAGQIVEEADVDATFYAPRAPYTLGLLKSVPRISAANERLKAIPGQPPSLINLPVGCPFQPRCMFTQFVGGNICLASEPELEQKLPDHGASCFLPISEIMSRRSIK